MPQKRRRSGRSNKKSSKARGRCIGDEFIDALPGLTPQTNPPSGTQILKDAMEGKKRDAAKQSAGDGTDGEKIGREARDIEDVVEWKSRSGLCRAKALDRARPAIGNGNGGQSGGWFEGG